MKHLKKIHLEKDGNYLMLKVGNILKKDKL